MIQKRFIAIINAETHKYGKYVVLEELTGIKTSSWRKAFNGGQKPSLIMLEAFVKVWPQYAYWLISGYTDSQNGHIAPNGEINDITKTIKIS